MGLGDWLYGFVLGFGGNVEILEPLALKGILLV
jgi:predicted DNA-binding transcriptional regulator YafY